MEARDGGWFVPLGKDQCRLIETVAGNEIAEVAFGALEIELLYEPGRLLELGVEWRRFRRAERNRVRPDRYGMHDRILRPPNRAAAEQRVLVI